MHLNVCTNVYFLYTYAKWHPCDACKERQDVSNISTDTTWRWFENSNISGPWLKTDVSLESDYRIVISNKHKKMSKIIDILTLLVRNIYAILCLNRISGLIMLASLFYLKSAVADNVDNNGSNVHF